MKEVLLKAWAALRTASLWTWQKSKDGVSAYKKRMKYKAVEKRRTERRIEAEDFARRQQEHKQLLECLSDEFNTIEHDLTKFIKSRSEKERFAVIERRTGQQQTSSVSGGLTTNLASAAFTFAGNVGPALRTRYVNKTMIHGKLTAMRSVSDFNPKELGALKLCSLLYKYKILPDESYEYIKRSFVFNGGNCILIQKANTHEANNGPKHMMAMGIAQDWLTQIMNPASIVLQEAITLIGQARNEVNNPDLASIIENELSGSSGWLKAGSL